MKAFPVICALVLVTASRANAQTPASPATVPRIDATALLGWHSASEELPGTYNSWYGGSLNRGVAVGYYWTEHLVTGVEAGWAGEGELFSEHPASAPAQQLYGYANHTYRTRNIAVMQRYQFRHNVWFHPYVAAGAQVEWVEHGGEVGPLYGRTGNLVQGPRPIPVTTEQRSNALASGGFKAYVSQRAFVRSEVRFGFAPEVRQVLVTIGFGVDF